MQNSKLLILLGIYLTCCIYSINGQCCEEYCYDTDPEKQQSSHFATKSAYEIIKGSDSQRQFVVPNCNPVKIWILSRHGTRLPSAKNMKELRELSDLRDEIIDNYEKRRSKPDTGYLCEEDLDILRHWNWNPNVTAEYSEYLTTQGWNDLKYLAINYQRIFPNMLENIYSKEKFLFRHTKEQRTEASFKAFVEGLFGEHAFEHIQLPPVPEKDMLLQPYDQCPAWVENNKRDDPNSEQVKFENSPLFQEAMRNVSMRLGFKFPLKTDKIKAIWDMCRYDQAWTLDRGSAWCSAFTPTQVYMLEYLEDLGYYQKSGYGAELNSNVACATVVDMLKHLESKENPKVITYFAHSSTIQLLLTALGAAKDVEAPRADNYFQMQRRKWKTSEISPFASNLAVIKYDCPHDNERNKIMFFLNQKPLGFTWCNVGLCNWSEVQRMYSSFRQRDCAHSFCTGSSSATSLTVTSLSSMFAIIGLYLWRFC